MSDLQRLENALKQLRAEGVTLSKKENAQLIDKMLEDLEEEKKRLPKSKFGRIIQDLKKFIEGPGTQIASIVKTVLSLL